MNMSVTISVEYLLQLEQMQQIFIKSDSKLLLFFKSDSFQHYLRGKMFSKAYVSHNTNFS